VGLHCRFCDTPLVREFVSLGSSPLSNAYLTREQLKAGEVFFPLDVYVCEECLLVQLPAYEAPERIFSDYAYFSSFSTSWLEHAKAYVDRMTGELGLGAGSMVVEVASNDGYLLQYFLEKGVPVLGVEPANTVAAAAREKGVRTVEEFFGVDTATRLKSEGFTADLLLGNNVLAHVPDLNDFVAGLAVLLKPDGLITMEFPHVMRLIAGLEFDTVYHEHFSYFSLTTVRRVFARHGLTVFDVEELSTHGGSLRILARHAGPIGRPETARVTDLLAREHAAGLDTVEGYTGFQERVDAAKRRLLEFLVRAKDDGASVVGYGAPAKGNTLLNYCGVRRDLLAYTVDRNPMKQARYLPGTHIPVYAPEKIAETRPDYVLVLPWNLEEEIVAQNAGIAEWGGRFVVPLPEVRVLEPRGRR
jgi:SAM-dependent methyltransferase